MKTTLEHAARRPGTPRASADMNLTPLIDVLLVLLIIFMTTVNLTQRGLDVNLPAVQPPAAIAVPTPQILVEYGADRRLTINTQPVALAALESRLRDILSARQDRTLFVRGDGSLRYGEMMTVLDAARGAGASRVGVVTPGAVSLARTGGQP